MLQLRRSPLRRFYGQGEILRLLRISAADSRCAHARKAPQLHHDQLLSTQALFGNGTGSRYLLTVLEQVRRRFQFDVIGFVVMPEHVHLLVGEPEKGNPSRVMQVMKQRVARRLLRKSKKRTYSQFELWKSPE